ncbi:MAG: WXG100 family type VII secretion target [Pirellulaceae bacterium]|nr:WXG100 family type VII secretion target [Pirellulaceae bacterium]
MPQAIVDPEELRHFARNLQKFNHELRDRILTLCNQLTALGLTWRDQEHKKFVEEFETNVRTINKLTEGTDEHVPYLLRKAQHIEDYLNS